MTYFPAGRCAYNRAHERKSATLVREFGAPHARFDAVVKPALGQSGDDYLRRARAALRELE